MPPPPPVSKVGGQLPPPAPLSYTTDRAMLAMADTFQPSSSSYPKACDTHVISFTRPSSHLTNSFFPASKIVTAKESEREGLGTRLANCCSLTCVNVPGEAGQNWQKSMKSDYC